MLFHAPMQGANPWLASKKEGMNALHAAAYNAQWEVAELL